MGGEAGRRIGDASKISVHRADLVASSLPGRHWERGFVPLKFQIGDIHLGKVVLPLFRRSAELDELALDIDETPEPPPQLDGADGYVVWSQPLVGRLPVLSVRHGTMVYAPRQYRRFSIQLSGDFKQYTAKFSARTRSNFRRKLRKFSAVSGGIGDWREYRTPAQMSQFFPLARQVSSKTYQERLLKIGFPSDPTFFRSALALSKDDRVRSYILFLKGEPVSCLYCEVKQQIVSYNYHGFDPAYAKLSPGTVLQMLALEALFAEQQFSIFDFTEGEGWHKEKFSTSSQLCGDVYVISRRFMPTSLVILHHAVNKTSASGARALDRMKLKSSLRRLLRGTWVFLYLAKYTDLSSTQMT